MSAGADAGMGAANQPTSPWLTVVTVVRNDPAALRRTLASVAAQDTSLLEHVIVDGASTDNTTEIAQAAATTRAWVRLRSAPDTGIYNAMNHGIELARGHHLLFLNAGDDFTTGDEVAAIYADWQRVGYEWGRYRARFVDAHRAATRPLASAELDVAQFLRGTQERYHQGAVMARSLLCDLGGFDERYRIVADFDLMRRALLAGYRPWVSERIITDYDASGLSAVAWRASLWEEHLVRSRGASSAAAWRSGALFAGRTAVIAGKRAARSGAERLLGDARVSRLRSQDLAAATGTHSPETS